MDRVSRPGDAPGPRTLRLAHRGDWRSAPENTIAAFLAAMAVPACDGIELDVRRARDGVAMCYHDVTLQRLHGDRRTIAELTSRELERFGIPTLAAALAAIPRRAFLDIELKGDPGHGAFEALLAGRGPALERGVISSFEPATLERMAGLSPGWTRWLNAHDASEAAIRTARELGCRAISVEWHALSGGTVRRVQAAGLDVAAWTVRRRPTFRRLERLGVVAICAEAAALDG